MTMTSSVSVLVTSSCFKEHEVLQLGERESEAVSVNLLRANLQASWGAVMLVVRMRVNEFILPIHASFTF